MAALVSLAAVTGIVYASPQTMTTPNHFSGGNNSQQLNLQLDDQDQPWGNGVSNTWSALNMAPGHTYAFTGNFVGLLSNMPSTTTITCDYKDTNGISDQMAQKMILTKCIYASSMWSIDCLTGNWQIFTPASTGNISNWKLTDVDGDGFITIYDLEKSLLTYLPLPSSSVTDSTKIQISVEFAPTADNNLQNDSLNMNMDFTPTSWDKSCSTGGISPTLMQLFLGQPAVSVTTCISVTSSQNPSIYGQPVTFTANVNAPSGTPTGTVQFQIDGTNFGSPISLTNGSASTAAISNLAVGNHSVTAVYSGDSNFATSTGELFGGQTVKQVFISTSTITVWAWGLNKNGQLGDGTNNILSNIPVEDNLPTGVTAISAGDDFSLALTSSGTIWAWGCTNQANDNGVLGNGTNTGSQIPVQVTMPAGVMVTAIAAGHDFSLALTSTGTVWAWGYGIDGELGNGTNTNSNIPVQVNMPSGVKVIAISAGGRYGLALTSGGKVWAWGYGIDGELGNGANTNSNIPVQVSLPSGKTITAIAAGHDSALALVSDGTVLAWGYNGNGELGNGNNANSNIPVSVQIPAGITVTAIAAGYRHNIALTSGGAVLAWGDNYFGELGNGNNTNSNIPEQVSVPSGVKVTAIGSSGDKDFSLALTSDDMVWAWGYGIDGELGNGNNSNSNIPVQVSMPASPIVTAIAAGGSHSLALVTATTTIYDLEKNP